MKIIKCLSEYIEEELHDADKYITKAMMVKSEYPDVAELLYQLSLEEMTHMNRLHSEVEKIIATYRRQTGEPPAEMQAVYDYVHQKNIEKAKLVKVAQASFRE
jgi:ferritin